MSLFDEGVCEVCGKPGVHEECKERERQIVAAFAANDAWMLRKHARYHVYGVHDGSRSAYERAVAQLERYLGHPAKFAEADVVEGGGWWFIPHGWIGVIGFVVEEASGQIYALGSGWGAANKTPFVSAHWAAIEAYLSQSVEPVERKGS